jgi:hypothetical protein
MVKVINKCEDCTKASVCKYAQAYLHDQNIQGIFKSETTVITIECKEFTAGTKQRGWSIEIQNG